MRNLYGVGNKLAAAHNVPFKLISNLKVLSTFALVACREAESSGEKA
jgi:hypothetical protein